MRNGILMLFLSDYEGNAQEKISTVKGNEYQCKSCQTDDTPVKYLLHTAWKQNDIIEKIVYIMNQKEKDADDGKKFEEKVKECIQGDEKLQEIYKEKMPEFESVVYNELEKDIDIRMRKIYYEISEKLVKEENACMYIHYIGGIQDRVFLAIAIIYYMEYHSTQYRKIVYSNWKEKVIQEIDDIHSMFCLIYGIDQFVRTGNARQLTECCNKKVNDDIDKMLERLMELSNVINLCDINNMDEFLLEISKELENYEKNRDRREDIKESIDKNQNCFMTEIFHDLIAVVHQKMCIQEKTGFSYPQLIRWCLDKNMVQQALTLYVEKMPKYYYDKKLLDFPEIKEIPPQGFTRETYAFYTMLFAEKGSNELIEFVEALEKIDREKKITQELQRVRENLSENAKRGLDRMSSFLGQHYVWKTQKSKGKRPEGFLNDKLNAMPATVNKFLTYVLHSKKAQNYFFYGGKDMPHNKGTYEKKVWVLEKIQKGIYKIPESRVGRQRLYEMMKYYLALKMVRNKINHASEEEITEDEKKTLKLLEQKHRICMDITVENVKKIIFAGLRV